MRYLVLLLLVLSLPLDAQEAGVSSTLIRLGTVVDLSGEQQAQGRSLRAGLEAALLERRTQGRLIELVIADHRSYGDRTPDLVRQLREREIFALIGVLGTASVHATLPILDDDLLLIGAVSGSERLRHDTTTNNIVNFRASYAQEIETLVQTALDAGLQASELCLLIQDDDYGLAGLHSLIARFAPRAAANAPRRALETVLNADVPLLERNGLGPVGIYPRHTERIREAYESLKRWEDSQDTECRLVIAAGHAAPIAAFIAYSRYKEQTWWVSALASTGTTALQAALRTFGIHEGVLHTQVVPSVNAPLPVVAQARQALGSALDPMALEGYIVGRLFLAVADAVEGPLTRTNFLAVVRGRLFSLDGLMLDFSQNNQGSDLVSLHYLQQSEFRATDANRLRQLLQAQN
jgi:ABC-type branched-subunit amino acid transport system substrate-binding protein